MQIVKRLKLVKLDSEHVLVAMLFITVERNANRDIITTTKPSVWLLITCTKNFRQVVETLNLQVISHPKNTLTSFLLLDPGALPLDLLMEQQSTDFGTLAAKCQLSVNIGRQVSYLGRIISSKVYKYPDPKSTAAATSLADSPPNKTVGDLRKLPGFLNYFRKFIQDFSRQTSPLFDLLKGNENKLNNLK